MLWLKKATRKIRDIVRFWLAWARQFLTVVGLVATVIATVYITRLAKRALTAELDRRGSIAGATQG